MERMIKMNYWDVKIDDSVLQLSRDSKLILMDDLLFLSDEFVLSADQVSRSGADNQVMKTSGRMDSVNFNIISQIIDQVFTDADDNVVSDSRMVDLTEISYALRHYADALYRQIDVTR